LALGNNGGQNFLYAADFHDDRIDVFNATFQPVTPSGGFNDPNLPAGFAPYNVVNIGGQLYISYAQQDAGEQNAVAGPGDGYVDVFNQNGVLQKQMIAGQPLNAPWGMALAPSNFGGFGNDLLVGNSGDGLIHAFDPQSGTLVGTLTQPSGSPLTIDGLRGLSFGNGNTVGNPNELFFSAGSDGGQHGLLGALVSAQGVSIAAQGTAVDATTGVSFNGTLAVFSDAQNFTAGSFMATIDWGDGSSTSGTVTSLAAGGFAVSGSHSYMFGGPKNISIQIRDPVGNTANAGAVASVASPGLSMTGLTIAPTEGAAFSGPVATFTDGDGNTSTAAYTATIVWGNGATAAGTVSFGGGKFSVLGTQTYTDEASEAVSVIVRDFDGASATVAGKANVADAPLTGTQASIAATLGATFSGSVASFTDANPNATTSDFTATIDWGDGTSSAGIVSAAAGATYIVAGSHTYAQAGSMTATVTINDVGGSQAAIDDPASVVDIDVLGATLASIAPTEGTPVIGTIATVVDSNLATTAGELAAAIDWGDGTTTLGTVTGAAGAFVVVDAHTYVGEGRLPLSVTVAHVGGTATATDQTTITVADTGTLSISGAAFAATEGETYSGEVATVSDTYAAPAADFTATIAWGDGTVSTASVSGPDGHFTLSGTHVYLEEGTYSPVVSIADLPPGSISETATLTTAVADAPIAATAATLHSTEGQAVSGTVATFDDASAFGAAGDFQATIDWGDGATTTGTVSGSPGAPGFAVAGTHTYTIGGTYAAMVTIDDTGGSTATATSSVHVADDPLTAAGVTIAGSEGQTFTGPVATFADTNPSGGDVADYSATIDWGDGGTSPASIAGSAGHYTVSGSHAFVDVSDAVVVAIHDLGGASATATSGATVADANTLTPQGPAQGLTLSATEGQTLSGLLATFADSYSGNPASDFSASVDWGDGQTTTADVTGQAGTFTVSGSHVYAEAGNDTAHVVLRHIAPGTANATADTAIDVADAALSASGATLSLTEGGTFAGTVASFNDANKLSAAADFTATIEWGDGTSATAGTLSQVAAGSFVVTGSHVYADDANNLPIIVVISDRGGNAATATGTATVADAPLTAADATIATTEGQNFSGTVATFTDGNLNATTADFTAAIDWGDGASATAGTISQVAAGSFVVIGGHTYTEAAANVPVTVTVNDRGGSTAIADSHANVADASLTAHAATFTATESVTFAGEVATFSDANADATTADFTATIHWGDGSAPTTGTVHAAAGGFVVSGSHLYAEEAARQVSVTLRDVAGSSATAASTADVVDAPLTPGLPLTIATTEGALFSGTVGTFSDLNPGAPLHDFTATIGWGDGGASLGTVLAAPGGAYVVSGSHTYTTPAAALQIEIQVNDVGGGGTIVPASVHVASTHFVASGATIAAFEGAAFSGIVATCDDSSTNPADYSALVEWGDGTTSAGTVAPAVGGGFAIGATHTFQQAGTTHFTVVVTNVALDRLTVVSQANVADPPLTPQGITIAATEGTAFSGPVATFAQSGGAVADYSATILWGDGQASTGTVTTAAGGEFVVLGSHVYSEETQGAAVTVAVKNVGGAQGTAASTANVADALLALSPLGVQVPSGGAADPLVLATLTDGGGAEPAADYSATIDWGDDTSLTGGTLLVSGTTLQIAGSHNYALPGSYHVVVTVRDDGGSTASATASATVAPTADQLFIEAAYRDVLQRPVDSSGLLYWSNQLAAGQPRSAVADAIDHSAEYFGQIIIAPAYERYLNRAADPGGLAYWTDQMQNHGLTDERLEAGFIGSAEFYARAGGTDQAWIDAMYQDLLGRPADASGQSFWLAELAAGAGRADMAYGFAAGTERETQRITDDFMHYLGRQPDQAGLEFWLGQFAAGVTNESLITGFVASDEYFKEHA
ncbi:MAG TPA: TIGR03118 family protein, partial [Pirellulales bacterium]|nr:TIGR03118 family protein [Pirellulales bacterium]